MVVRDSLGVSYNIIKMSTLEFYCLLMNCEDST